MYYSLTFMSPNYKEFAFPILKPGPSISSNRYDGAFRFANMMQRTEFFTKKG